MSGFFGLPASKVDERVLRSSRPKIEDGGFFEEPPPIFEEPTPLHGATSKKGSIFGPIFRLRRSRMEGFIVLPGRRSKMSGRVFFEDTPHL